MMRPNIIYSRFLRIRHFFILFCFAGLSGITVYGQQEISTSGADATGSGGTASYTVGQAIYTTIANTSKVITQGVQQPYLPSNTTSIQDASYIDYKTAIYPNPTSGDINLQIGMEDLHGLRYELYSMQGIVLMRKSITSANEIVSMTHLRPAVYILKVTDNNNKVRTYRIVKL